MAPRASLRSSSLFIDNTSITINTIINIIIIIICTMIVITMMMMMMMIILSLVLLVQFVLSLFDLSYSSCNILSYHISLTTILIINLYDNTNTFLNQFLYIFYLL